MLILIPGKELCLRSVDNRFGIQLEAAHVASLLAECRRAGNQETGGILIGHYSRDHAMAFVIEVTSAPIDSKRGYTWFDRGISGLKRKLQLSWRKANTFYLGEWHFHPGASPNPSAADSTQMAQIATSPHYACPEPILLIVGGSEEQRSVAAYVYEQGSRRHTLARCDEFGGQHGESSDPSPDRR